MKNWVRDGDLGLVGAWMDEEQVTCDELKIEDGIVWMDSRPILRLEGEGARRVVKELGEDEALEIELGINPPLEPDERARRIARKAAAAILLGLPVGRVSLDGVELDGSGK